MLFKIKNYNSEKVYFLKVGNSFEINFPNQNWKFFFFKISNKIKYYVNHLWCLLFI